ncbi:MAG: penicillin-binding transpeptidase domain-containing protein [Clostridia bacterium]|nr:penicillin-binding transpeptidase domain-containing protein [Clostridia bacterium]
MARKKEKKINYTNTATAVQRRAILLTFISIMLLFGYAVIYLVKWQVIRSEELKSAVLDQSLASTMLTANRGTIYDCTGTKVLAQSAQVWTIAAEPYFIGDDDEEAVAAGVSRILGIDYQYVLDIMNTDYYYYILKRKVDTAQKEELVALLESRGMERGLIFEKDYKRYYPYGTEASVIIGYTGTDNTGLAGIEHEYEQELSGTTGRMINSKDATGEDMPFEYEQLINAEDGYNLVLTIDETVQAIVEKYLNEGVERYYVQNGAVAILMDCNNGAIKAIAQAGSPDPNNPDTIVDADTVKKLKKTKDDDEYNELYYSAYYKQWRNKAVSDTYMPGSVFKMVTASMALDSGAITEKTKFNCEGSYVPFVNEDPINCWVYPFGHGKVNVWGGIGNSCNPFFMQVGEKLGPHDFFKYFQAFGMTDLTGIDLPGETLGLYYDEDSLNPVELATETFGQNFTITPIQMITAACAVTNGGYLVQPHVVDKIIDSDGNVVSSSETYIKRQVISSEVSELMCRILEENATTGSGMNGYVAGYHVAGKTGTSEKITDYNAAIARGEKGAQLQYIASFCGVAPANDPQYALLVFYDEPDRSNASGGGMAAPTFSQIMTEVLPILGVQRDESEVYAEDTVKAPNFVGMTIAEAREALGDEPLYLEVFGNYDDTDMIVTQVPSAGSELPVYGDVVVYTKDRLEASELSTVPNFNGLDLDNTRYLAAINGVQLIVAGNASDVWAMTATSQDIPAGDKVKPGTVITVTFMSETAAERN